MSFLHIGATAFGLGLVFNAAPGPVFAATLRHGVAGGFRPALAVQIGSLAGDALWAVLGLGAVGLLALLDAARAPMTLAGAGYLGWLAWESWEAGRTVGAGAPAAPGRDRPGALWSGALLSLTNPQNLAYWAALGSTLGALGVDDPGSGQYGAFLGGFLLSSIVWAIVFAAIVDRLVGRAEVRWARITYRLCAVAFAGLGLLTLLDLFTAPRSGP